jgi:hypothetical protein
VDLYFITLGDSKETDQIIKNRDRIRGIKIYSKSVNITLRNLNKESRISRVNIDKQ